MVRLPPGELRSKILEATIAAMRRTSDPRSISIDEVVTAVGCTPPALYHYFPTKDHLLLEAARQQYVAFAADLEAATPQSGDALVDLRARGEAYLAWARQHPAVYRHLFMTRLDLDDPEAVPRPPDAVPDFREVPGLSALVSDVERANDAGHDLGDPQLTAFALWAVVHGFASLAITEPDIPAAYLLAGLRRVTEGMYTPPTAG